LESNKEGKNAKNYLWKGLNFFGRGLKGTCEWKGNKLRGKKVFAAQN